MGRKQPTKIKVTPELLKMVEQFGVIRLPHDQIAIVLGVSKDTFELQMKRDPSLRQALDKGRASSSIESRKTLYQMAVKEKNPRMLEFYLKTQEGFKSIERLELTGANGGPVKTQYEGLSDEQLLARLKELKYED